MHYRGYVRRRVCDVGSVLPAVSEAKVSTHDSVLAWERLQRLGDRGERG